MITNLRAFQELLKRNNLPTPDTYLGISELIRSLYRPDVSPNPERIREVLEELTWPVTVPAGNPITFKSCSEVLASEALVTFAPKQSGTGDPSPSNIRPISGWDGLYLYVDEEQSETPANTYTATFPSTIMGGSYDFVSGLGNETHRIWIRNGSENNWAIQGEGTSNQRYLISYGEPIPINEYVPICNMFKWTPSQTLNQNFGVFRLSSDRTTFIIYDGNQTFESLSAFKTWLTTHNIIFAFLRPTPTEITLTPADVNLLKGSNTVWTDGDNVTVKFQILK